MVCFSLVRFGVLLRLKFKPFVGAGIMSSSVPSVFTNGATQVLKFSNLFKSFLHAKC